MFTEALINPGFRTDCTFSDIQKVRSVFANFFLIFKEENILHQKMNSSLILAVCLSLVCLQFGESK